MKSLLKSSYLEFKSSIIFMMVLFSSSYAIAQCTTDVNDPTFSGCLANQTITLGAGECRVSLPVSATDDCTGNTASFTLNSPGASGSLGHGCLMGNTSYFQIFTPTDAPRFTPMKINQVTFNVFNAVNSPFVMVRVYKTDGTLNVANWTLLGANSSILINASNSTATIPVVSSTVNPTETFAIEIITPTSAVFNEVAGFTTGNTKPTYVRSSACGISTLTNAATILGAGASLGMSVGTSLEDVMITPNSASTPALGTTFKPGTYTLSYLAVDAKGNDAVCNTVLTVNRSLNSAATLVCNNQVNISLEDICTKKILPQEILEGNVYGCYENFSVIVYDANNRPIGDSVDASHVGKTLRVSVLDSIGNSCWGLAKIENKTPAILKCEPIYTNCLIDPLPGSDLPARITYQPENSKGAAIASNNKNSTAFEVDVFGSGGAIVNDVDVSIKINHTNVADLQITLTSPSGITTKLVANAGVNCVKDNIDVVIDDAATMSFASMSTACATDTVPGVRGRFKPQTPLSVYNGLKLDGKWIITVIDSTSTNGGAIKELALTIGQTGGKVTFPTDKNVTFTRPDGGDYLVNGLDACGQLQMSFVDDKVEQPCSSIYTAIINRTWGAKDVSGNDSRPCTQKIYVYRNGVSTLQFPPNYDDLERPALSCNQYGASIPTPEITGSPSGELCNNVQILPYTDVKIDICDNSYKILRKWSVVEWCSGEVYTHLQIIKVLDKQGPTLTCPRDTAISTDAVSCNRDFTPARPIVGAGECSSDLTYKLSYSYIGRTSGPIPADSTFTVIGILDLRTLVDMPVGFTAVRWRVEDECGNVSVCTYRIEVKDLVPPVAICDQFTKVSIGSNKLAYVAASTFDDGSLDNCGIVKMEVRKMTDRCFGNTNFRDSAVFCCTEVNSTIMVELRVSDASGNRNTCMVEIRVEDKLPPYITQCPENITLDCQADFKNTVVTGLPDFVDNCEVVSVNFIDNGGPDQCGRGTIQRTWTVKDAQNLAASCVQTISLVDKDPFDRFDITFRPDYSTSVCNAGLLPENLPAAFAYPVISDDDCSLTSVTYSDQTFKFVDGACEKILRTWTVIDWCTHVPGTTTGIYTDLQIIVLENKLAPTFTNCPTERTVDVFDNCRGSVSQSIQASDLCTKPKDLKYTYQIDLNGDGLFAGEELTTLRGTDSTFTKFLPIGVHNVIWTVQDQCGNKATCSYKLTVRDGKKPTPYCLSSVTTVVMPTTGNVAIWAKDFDLGSFDNCTPRNKLNISFSTNVLDTGKVLTCSNIPDGRSVKFPIDIYITDEAGNREYCSVNVIIQDNEGNVCKDNNGSLVAVGGRIKTENNKSLNGAMVSLYNDNNLVQELMTTSAGNFILENIDNTKAYQLGANKNDDVNNGISTLDLVLIQRHILGLQKFTSPYKYISADANNDSRISAADLVALRKVILGISTEFINNQKSWRFLNSLTPFSDPNNPFPYNERINLNLTGGSVYDQDLYAVKIGDVNTSVQLSANDNNAEPRSNKNLQLNYSTKTLGDKNIIEVYADEDVELNGFQAKLNIGNAQVIGKALAIASDNYVSNDEETAISWNSDAKQIKKGTLLFAIEFTGKQALVLNENFSNEAYLESFEISKIQFKQLDKNNLENSFEVFQNEPNPFAAETRIGFKLPESSKVSLKIYDQTGKILHRQSASFDKGLNYFSVSQSNLQVSGIMYYEVSSGNFKQTRKMIGLN
jgi:subtilisin-like proprotein convertase family protein